MFVKKIDDMERERQEMYLVLFKKGKEVAGYEEQEVRLRIPHLASFSHFLDTLFSLYIINKRIITANHNVILILVILQICILLCIF